MPLLTHPPLWPKYDAPFLVDRLPWQENSVLLEAPIYQHKLVAHQVLHHTGGHKFGLELWQEPVNA
jgi:hypothetical protein